MRRPARLGVLHSRAWTLCLLAGTACTSSDSDIAPDVAARAARAAVGPVAFIDGGVESLALAPGQRPSLSPVMYDSSGTVLTNRLVSYRTLDSSVVGVDMHGRLTARAPGQSAIIATSERASDTIDVGVATSDGRTVRVHVFLQREFQSIDGWEAHHQSGEIDCNPANFALYQGELFDRTVSELGINRIRLEVRSGMEAPHLERPGGNEPQSQVVPFRTPWFSPVNDNADPHVADTAGFQFEWFDYNVEHTVLPLRERLARRGERLYLNLTYVDFFATTPFEQLRDPEEYAELMAVTFDHMQRTFGFVPDAVEAILEPDNTPWTPEQVGRAIVAAGDRLKAAGYRPDFISPSTTNMGEAVRYFDRLRSVPHVMEYLRVLAYHRYSGISDASLHQLQLRAHRDGLRLAMLEHGAGTADELHDDLALGHVGSWERFALAYCGRRANAAAEGVYYQIFLKRGAAPRVILTDEGRLLRHYFAYVRQGAVRLGAATTDSDISPVAFRNTNGALVVVLRARRGGAYSVEGLRPGKYGVVSTTARDGRSENRDVDVVSNEFSGSIADAGFVTIFER